MMNLFSSSRRRSLRLFLLTALIAGLATLARAQLTRTPALTEGPYYTFNSSQRLAAPTDQDSDLTTISPSTTAAGGTLFILSGTLVNLSGTPLSGAVIELWQTDDNGVYYHSSDSLVTRRDTRFQGFGKATTDSVGRYAFRTVRPGLYTGRIRHFHFKVKINGTEILTSQFVFEDQRSSFSTDNVTATLSGASLEAIVLTPVSGTDSNGASALLASKQIVVNATATSTGTAPSITASPLPAAIAVGESVTFSVTATGTTPLSYQWMKDSVAIAGATGASLTLASAAASSAGNYTVVVTNSAGSATSSAASLMVTAATSTNALINLSTRAYLPSSSGVIIAGFVVRGADGKQILVRAIGPSLSSFKVSDPIADPSLEVYDSSGIKIAQNDNWSSTLSALFSSLGAFALPQDSKDAALTVTLANGSATAQLRGDAAGIGLIEAYDASTTSASRLVNLSSRSYVGTDDNVLVAGFVVDGTGGKRLLIRGIGPRLSAYNVTNPLSDPKIAIYKTSGTNTKIAENDNWSSDLKTTFTQVGAFSLIDGSKDAALVVTLPAGEGYTAVVSGVDGATGEALVELYDLSS